MRISVRWLGRWRLNTCSRLRLRRLFRALVKPGDPLARLWIQRIDPQRLLQTSAHICGIVHNSCEPDPRIFIVSISLNGVYQKLARLGALPGARCCNTLLEQLVRCRHRMSAPSLFSQTCLPGSYVIEHITKRGSGSGKRFSVSIRHRAGEDKREGSTVEQ